MAKRILVVEDDRDFAESVAGNLEAVGYDLVGVAHSGLDAFQLCEGAYPNVALIDIGLEGAFDGIFLGEQLAERGIAVIYLTGRFDRAVQEGRDHAAALLSKPCTLTELTDAIERATAAAPNARSA